MSELTASEVKRDAARIGALAGLVAGPGFLASAGLNTWASLDYLHGLGWEFVGGDEVPWPSSLLAIIATGVLAPLTMALALRGDVSWRPIARVSLSAAVLFVAFLLLPWGNATFLAALATLFAWIAAVAARLRALLA